VQTKNDFILADLWSQSEFRTQRKSQRSETIQRIDNLNTNTVLSGLLDFCNDWRSCLVLIIMDARSA